MKVAFKIGCPNQEELYQWGDYYFVKSFGDELKRRGHDYCIQLLPDWYVKNDCDVVVHLRGLSKYKPSKSQLNIMWNLSHPEQIKYKEYEKYDVVFIASEHYAKVLQEKVKVPVYPLLQFVDTSIFFNEYTEKYTSDVLFVGNTRNIFRDSVKYCLESDNNLTVYGVGWDKFIPSQYIANQWFPNDELRKLYSSTRILLNDHWEDMKSYNFINNRFFDAAACGTVILNDHVEEISQLFKSAIVYHTKEEFQYLLEDIKRQPLKYQKQALDLQREVLENHTVKHRVDQFLKVVGYYDDENQKHTSLFKYYKHKLFKLKLRLAQEVQIRNNKKKAFKHQIEALTRGMNITNQEAKQLLLQGNIENRKHIAFLITEYEQILNAGDKYAALGIGEWLKTKYNCMISYYVKVPEYEWGNISNTVDYIICMTPDVYIKPLVQSKAKVVAWIRGNYENWIKLMPLKKIDGIITSSNILQIVIRPHIKYKQLLGVTNLAIPLDLQRDVLEEVKYSDRKIDISFIGNIRNQERYIVNNLEVGSEINFKFYGNLDENHPWNKYYGGAIKHEDIKKVYLDSKIVIEDIAPLNKGTVNLRIFEAAICGAMVIANEDQALLELFEEDEIVMYKDKQDLNTKLEFYLSNDEERIKQARKLREKVITQYTFEKEAGLFMKCLNKVEE